MFNRAQSFLLTDTYAEAHHNSKKSQSTSDLTSDLENYGRENKKKKTT